MTSCCHALEIGLRLFDLPPKANVLIPAVTFPACPLAVERSGATAVLADVDPSSWQLTPAIARAVATKMPIHAVMPVAVYGVPVPAAEWDKFTEDTRIPVIIDAAAALEAQPVPQKCLLAHSLHATKPFCVGEGGLLVGRDIDQINRARFISNFGTQMRIATQSGMNAKMSEVVGAVCLAQMARWPEMKSSRKAVYAKYRLALEKAGLDVQFQPGLEKTIVSTIMLQLRQPVGASIADKLSGQGISTHRMYLPPLYHHPHFAGLTVTNIMGQSIPSSATLKQKTALMETSEMLHQYVFGIPFHVFMDDEDIACVVQALLQAIDKPLNKATVTAR